MVKETPDEPSPAKRSKGGLVGKRCKPKSSLKLVDEPSDERVPVEEPAHTNEEADLQWALELSLKEQAKRTPSSYKERGKRKSLMNKHGPNPGEQDEGQAGPNPGIQDEGQAGSNPGIQDEGQAGSNPGDAA
ncbi:retrovirus-related pol polyprotein from transposon TNT 1-94 [Tanacetum coccineum]